MKKCIKGSNSYDSVRIGDFVNQVTNESDRELATKVNNKLTRTGLAKYVFEWSVWSQGLTAFLKVPNSMLSYNAVFDLSGNLSEIYIENDDPRGDVPEYTQAASDIGQKLLSLM